MSGTRLTQNAGFRVCLVITSGTLRNKATKQQSNKATKQQVKEVISKRSKVTSKNVSKCVMRKALSRQLQC